MREHENITVYFGRPVTHYPYILKRDAMLRAARDHKDFPLDFEILDPDSQAFENIYQGLKSIGCDGAFNLFVYAAMSSDYMIAATFADGAVGAGVAKEVHSYFQRSNYQTALTDNLKVFIIRPENGNFVVKVARCMQEFREECVILTVDQTRERIRKNEV